MSNNKSPFFSIIIPVYNSEQYLNKCIESVFEQTCKDFELILVDDQSKDSSGKICDEWKLRFPEKIRVIHQRNTGVYIAKRNGIKVSEGQYIYVIDNDDLIISNTALEEVKNIILSQECDLVIFNATDNLKTKHLLCNIPFKDREVFENDRLHVLYDEYLSTKNLHHIWMMIFKRELFDWNYEYEEAFRMLRDGPALVLPVISNANKAIFLKNIFYYWRIQNQDSASKHYDVISFYYSIRLLHERVIKYSREWQFKSQKTNELVRSNYITDICIAAIKARSISPDASLSRKDFLKMLSNDKMFRKEYTLKHLENYRKIIAFLLYHKQVFLINVVSSIVGFLKRR